MDKPYDMLPKDVQVKVDNYLATGNKFHAVQVVRNVVGDLRVAKDIVDGIVRDREDCKHG